MVTAANGKRYSVSSKLCSISEDIINTSGCHRSQHYYVCKKYYPKQHLENVFVFPPRGLLEIQYCVNKAVTCVSFPNLSTCISVVPSSCLWGFLMLWCTSTQVCLAYCCVSRCDPCSLFSMAIYTQQIEQT
jgi:hypothetical protein